MRSVTRSFSNRPSRQISRACLPGNSSADLTRTHEAFARRRSPISELIAGNCGNQKTAFGTSCSEDGLDTSIDPPTKKAEHETSQLKPVRSGQCGKDSSYAPTP